MGTYVADFETTTVKTGSRVWGYGCMEIGKLDSFFSGNNLDEFMRWTAKRGENHIIFFHNLRWDGQFILNWLFRNNFTFTVEAEERASNTFNTLISDEGEFYRIEVIYKKQGKNINKVTFLDSFKLLPMGVQGVSDSFRLHTKKLELDYAARNDAPPDKPLEPFEIEYIKHDVFIIAQALERFISEGHTRMTIGSNALADYKKSIGKKTFQRLFPTLTPECFEDLRQGFRGSYTYLRPEFAGQVIPEGVVIDVNALYADRMKECLLPYGTPSFYFGQYKYDEVFPLFTQMIRCQFDLKPGKLPTIQVRYGYDFEQNEYLTSSNDNEVVLCLNSVDLKLFFEQYEVYNIEYIAGWKYQAATGLFDSYIDKWNDLKIKSKEDGNAGMYQISKLFLVSLYGKFGSAVKTRSKYPYLDTDDKVKFQDSPPEVRNGVYLPVASFTSSYAREKTIRAAQKVMDDYNAGKSNIQFVYADTDSLHCISPDQRLPEGFEIDDTALGCWKFESKFKQAKYLRQKCYIQYGTADVWNDDPEYKMKVTVAGMPDDVKHEVSFHNFRFGQTFGGALHAVAVPGGVVLEEKPFTLKP